MKKLFISIIRNIVIPEMLEFVNKKIKEKGGDTSHTPSRDEIESHLVARSMEVLELDPWPFNENP